jgi:hypothetical protein
MVDFKKALEELRKKKTNQAEPRQTYEERTDMARDIEREETNDADDGMSLNAFLGHRTSGGSGEFLEPWRDKGSVRIWLHTKAGFHALWNHNWPRVVTVKDRQTKEDKLIVVSSRFVCHDPETVTRKARFKDDDGRREHSPVRCPICFMLDWISAEVAAGRLDWCTPIFQFNGEGDEERNITLHAGGMIGLFGKKELSKEELQQMKKAGVSRKTAWREKIEVRCQYLFQVVDDQDPSAGVVKALEAGDLGDKLKEELRKEIKKRGERGNPAINPYPLLWEYDENEEQFGKKYKVTALSDDKPSRTILNLIQGPKLDLSKDIAPGNCIGLRAEMEQHALIDLPFDDFFAQAEREGLMREQKQASKTSSKPAQAVSRKPPPAARDDEDEDDEEEDEEEDDEPESDPKPAAKTSTAKTNAPAAQQKKQAAPPDTSPCDFCGKPIGDDDLICPHCKSTFADEGKLIVLDGIACEDCKTIVPLKQGTKSDEGEGERFICPSCATIHELSPTLEEFVEAGGRAEGYVLSWKVVERHPPAEPPKEEKPKGGRRGRGAAKKEEPSALPSQVEGDPLPF